jgi:sec-independent protein translocase protein TatA
MFGLGMSELVVILLILLLLFGASRLPGIAAGLGGAVHTFRKSIKGDGDEDDEKKLEAKSETAKDVTPKSEEKTA